MMPGMPMKGMPKKMGPKMMTNFKDVKKMMGSKKKGGMKKKLTSGKAKKILKEGKARGKSLTDKQKKFFGAVAGGQQPRA